MNTEKTNVEHRTSNVEHRIMKSLRSIIYLVYCFRFFSPSTPLRAVSLSNGRVYYRYEGFN